MTITMPIAKARNQLTKLPKELKADDIVTVTSNGKPVLAIMSAELLDSIVETLEIYADPEMMKALREGIADLKNGRMIPIEDVRKELGL